MVSWQDLIVAKVPILRIKPCAPFEDIVVDINANNSVAVRNTHLLCYYSSCEHPRALCVSLTRTVQSTGGCVRSSPW